ncbi:MAG: thermonuclease family protein [Desulfovibrionaceae bacterium]
MPSIFTISIVIVFLSCTIFAEANTDILYVYDGDTVQYRENGKIYRLRMYGIDSPEMDQPYGKESRAYLESLIKNAQKKSIKIFVKTMGKDAYGRVVGVLYIKEHGKTFGALLIKQGLARVYKKYCKEKELCATYILLEKEARKNAVGMWKIRSQ